jgi:hypothetical protein
LEEELPEELEGERDLEGALDLETLFLLLKGHSLALFSIKELI